MHYHTCKSLLNTLRRAVEQLARCLAKQQKPAVEVKVQQPGKCQRPSAKLSYEYLGRAQRARSPTLVVKTENCLYVYIYVYMFGTCVFRICIHPAPFVRDAIFPHCMLVHVTTVVQD